MEKVIFSTARPLDWKDVAGAQNLTLMENLCNIIILLSWVTPPGGMGFSCCYVFGCREDLFLVGFSVVFNDGCSADSSSDE